MSINPYESPQTESTPRRRPSSQRVEALQSLRVALLILLMPAVYNFYCFSFQANANRIQLPADVFYRLVNTIGFGTIVLAIWFFGLAALDFITCGIQWVSSRRSTPDDWKAILYAVLLRAPGFAFFGAILWTIWVAAFYQLGVDFFVISVPVGVAAHALAAGLYLPLFFRWYKMERASAKQSPTGPS